MFEYLVTSFEGRGQTDAQHQDQLNELGAQGWELVAVEFHNRVTAYLKRPKAGEPSA